MSEHVVVQMPEGEPGQLFLLFHGVGSTPESLVPVGERLAEEFPSAAVISVRGPDASDMGSGYQWFSVAGVTEESRAGRIAATLPRFVETVRRVQAATGASAAQTALLGFSQGAIMALAATQLPGDVLAGRVISLAGRFAGLPAVAPAETTLHLIHGRRDPVIAHEHSVAAAERLIELGGDVTADVIAGLGHSVDQEVVDLLVHRLKTHVPKRVWEQAMAAAAGPAS